MDLKELEAALEEKTERWVYLNELKEQIDAQNGGGAFHQESAFCTVRTSILSRGGISAE